MTLNYERSKPSKDDIEYAINLIEKEFDRSERNTPIKMVKLIKENFDIICNETDILSFFGLEENYEQESLKIEHYDN